MSDNAGASLPGGVTDDAAARPEHLETQLEALLEVSISSALHMPLPEGLR